MIENEDAPEGAAAEAAPAPPEPAPASAEDQEPADADEGDLLADIRAHIEALMGTDVAAMVEKALEPFEERLRRLEVGMKHFL